MSIKAILSNEINKSELNLKDEWERVEKVRTVLKLSLPALMQPTINDGTPSTLTILQLITYHVVPDLLVEKKKWL